MFADLPERLRFAIENPVVTAGVVAPYGLCVGENQEMLEIGGPEVVVDSERLFLAGRRELGGADEDGAFANGGGVADDFLGVFHRCGRLDGRVGGAVFEPAGGPEGFGGEVVGVEETAEEFGGAG